MKSFLAILGVFVLMVTASPSFTITTKDAATVVAADTPIPTCTFDLSSGQYKCPYASEHTTESGNIIANVDMDTTIEDNAVTAAADCRKCQNDWTDCMGKWGCWFYDCTNACKCEVVKNDPSCKDCSAGQCHARKA